MGEDSWKGDMNASSGSSDEGGASIVKTILEHPMSAMALLSALLGVTFVGISAWYQVNGDLSKLQAQFSGHAQQIRQVEEQVRSNDSKSTNKLDRLQSDMGDIKTGMQRVQTSVEFLIRQTSSPSLGRP